VSGDIDASILTMVVGFCGLRMVTYTTVVIRPMRFFCSNMSIIREGRIEVKEMTYQIWIWADANGNGQVGAKDNGQAVIWDHIYPSQMRYRVVARTTDGKYTITTKTGARAYGYTVTYEFPRADGSLGRRYRR